MAAPGKATVAANAPLTKAQLLDLHPWPADLVAAKKIERLWTFDLPGTPAALWPLLSDTSRLNRALGTAVMTFEERDGKRYGSSKNGGVKHEWLEVPWNWVSEQWLTSTRLYDRGFMKASYAIHRLEPVDGGTRVYLYYGCVARGAFGATALRLGFPTLERAYRRVLPQIAAQLDRLKPEILLAPPTPLDEESESRLRAGREQLVAEGLPRACVDALIDWIRTGDDIDLHRIQVLERARVWKLPTNDVLRTALHATRAGLLDLSWDTICPHCRGLREETAKMDEIQSGGHCDVCDIDFTTDSVEAVEVTFRVHPSIREVAEQLYCSAEPATKDHIRVQATLAPGAKQLVRPQLARGRYTVWAGHRGGWYLDVDEGGPEHVAWADHPEGTVIRASTTPTVEPRTSAARPSCSRSSARRGATTRCALARCSASRSFAICSASSTSAPT